MVVTVSQNATISNPEWLFSFTHIFSKQQVRFIPTNISTHKTRYDEFEFVEGDGACEIRFPYEGLYTYGIYEQTAGSGNLNPLLSMGLIEAGQAQVIVQSANTANDNWIEYVSSNEDNSNYIFAPDEIIPGPPNPSCTPNLSPSATPTPTPTPATPTPTPTNTSTPTSTPTPTPTPATFFGYLFPEPLDSTSQNDLGQYLSDNGATWFGFVNSGGVPNSTDYSSNFDTYAHFNGWSGLSGNFVSNITSFSSPIRQSSGIGTDSYGCPQDQYTFGTIEVSTSQINPSIQYNYTVWIPLAGVGGTLNNMTIDIGSSTPCNTTIADNFIPDSNLSVINVVVTSGAIIPAGTYRVLWNYTLPISQPLTNSLFFKGDTKS